MVIYRGCITALVIIILAGCDWFSNPDDAPEPPVMLGNPADTSYDETGIDAIPEANWIQVQWLTSGLTGVQKYRLYRFSYDDDTGLKTDQDSLIAVIEDREVVQDTALYTDEDVYLDIRYYYYVRSVDGENNASDPSAMASYKLISKVGLTRLEEPRKEWTDSSPVFKIQDLTADISIKSVVIKVYDVNTGRIIWISDRIDPFNLSTVSYNNNGRALYGYGTLTADRNYKWRVDASGRNAKSGSESGWVEFSIVNN